MLDSNPGTKRLAPDAAIIECPADRRAEAIGLLAAAHHRSGMQALAAAVDTAHVDDWRGLRISVGADGGIIGAVWVQRAPGGVGVLWPPADRCGRKSILLREAGRWSDQSGLYFTQVILAVELPRENHRALEKNGFCYLADLATLAGSPNETWSHESAGTVGLQCVCWDKLQVDQYHRFATLFDAVNADTRDFPELVQSRPTQAVYEGFLGRGGMEQGVWRVLLWHGRDAGLLLLAPHQEACSMELLLMGVHPAFRGNGLGRAITQEASLLAREHGYQLILTADARNSQALALYREAGLQVVCTSRLFVRFSSRLKDQ